jgi:hypothetical protein
VTINGVQQFNLNLADVKSILIVDDSPHIRRSLRTLFEEQPE